MKRTLWNYTRNFPLMATLFCTSAALLLTACDNTPRGGAGDTTGTSRDTYRDTNAAVPSTPDAADDTARDAGNALHRGATNATDQVGKGLDKAGEEIQRQSR